jgi:prepilin-type N-terminal cleavage/methylation domain-containing protein
VSSADLRRRGGFTLVELMVALVIAGFIMATVFQILTGQSRVTAVQGAREETQQNLRGALEIVSSDLRAAIPQGILAAEDRAITFMQPRAWGLVCGSDGADVVDAIFPSTQALDAFNPGTASGVVINVGTTAAPDWQPRTLATWATVTAVAQLGDGDAGLCANDPMGSDGGVVSVQITATGIGALAARPREIVLYSLTRYTVEQVDDEWWLHRSNGWDGADFDMQPLAGPLAEDEGVPGLTFSYFDAPPPAAPVAAPGTTPAGLEALRRVGISVKTQSQQTVNSRHQQDSGAVSVTLRNAPLP